MIGRSVLRVFARSAVFGTLCSLRERWRCPAPVRKGPGKPQRFRPAVMLLEDRLTPTTFHVLTTSDGTGIGSLRDAITAANLAGGADDIVFDVDGVFAVDGTANGALPAISGDLTITGNGAALDNVQRTTGAIRIFRINGGVTVTIDSLTISGGNESIGGGILNGGTLTLRSSTLSGNNASFEGGGIYNSDAAVLTVQDSTLAGNDG